MIHFDIYQNKNKIQETVIREENISLFSSYFLFKIESDIEQEESVCSDDKSNVTTDDEFYNELMSAPAELEDHLSEKQKK